MQLDIRLDLGDTGLEGADALVGAAQTLREWAEELVATDDLTILPSRMYLLNRLGERCGTWTLCYWKARRS